MARPNRLKKGPKLDRDGLYRIRRGGDRKPGGGILSGVGDFARKLVGATKAGDQRRAARRSKRAGRRAERGKRKELRGLGLTRKAAREQAPIEIQAKKDAIRAENRRKSDFKKEKQANSGTIQIDKKSISQIPQEPRSKTPIGYTPKGPSETTSDSNERKGVRIYHGPSGTRTVNVDGTETFVKRPEDKGDVKKRAFEQSVREQKMSGGLGFSAKGKSTEGYYDTSSFDRYNPHMANPEYDSNKRGGHIGPDGNYINPKLMYKPQEQQDMERAGLQGYYNYKQQAGDKAISRDEWLAGEGNEYVYKGKTEKYIPFKKKNSKTKRKKK